MKIHGSSSVEPQKVFAVSLAPPPSFDVEYYGVKELSLYVTNLSDHEQLLDSVILQFLPDVEVAPVFIKQSCGARVAIGKAVEVKLLVRPSPLYREATNAITAMLDYRPCNGGKLGALQKEKHYCAYLIIKRSADDLGDVFISFKQDEDLPLAEILAKYAGRAGFKPYIAKSKPALGTDQWDRIEAAVKSASAVFVIWTMHTEFGAGVRAEVELARKNEIQEVLLIANDLELPDLYRDTKIEYKKFEPEKPWKDFADAVTSLRNQIVK